MAKKEPIKKAIKMLNEYFGLDDLLALLALAAGILYYFFPTTSQFYKDIHVGLIDIGITVLILGNADQYLRIRSEKRRLILQMGSPDNSFACEAVRQLRQREWLGDGTLRKAILKGANLEGAELWEANLERANLVGANFVGADLRRVYLKDAEMWEANLQGADLVGSDLAGANLIGANLTGAEMYNTNLQGVSLIDANLAGADLGKILYDENTEWKRAIFDGDTKLPDGFNPEAVGAIIRDHENED